MDSLLPDATDLQKQKLVSQAQELQNQEKRAHADPALAARLEAYKQEQRSIGGAAISEGVKARAEAAKSQSPEEDEKQFPNQSRNAEPIRNASVRYAQALGMHYNVMDPYASLARAAMAEHASFSTDRERLDKQIAQASNPEVRRALEIRKEIEKADYVALTSDRIARQSYVITGKKGPNSEFEKFSKQAEDNRQHATELRQQWRSLTDPDRPRPTDKPTPQNTPANNATGPNRYAALKAAYPAKDEAAELQKAQQQQLQRQRHRGPKM
jgi:hypothetical protein